MVGPQRLNSLSNECFRIAISFRHQVRFAFVFDSNAPPKIRHQQGPSLTRNIAHSRHKACFKIWSWHIDLALLTASVFTDVDDVVLKDEEVGLVLAG